MALTKENLQQIKLPLSDNDYVRLRKEELETNGEVWNLASRELRDSYEDSMLWWFGQHVPQGLDVDNDDIIYMNMWYPPKTEEYKDYPNYLQESGDDNDVL